MDDWKEEPLKFNQDNSKREKRRKKRQQRKRIRKILISFIVIVIVCAIGIGLYYITRDFIFAPKTNTESQNLDGEDITITIPSGATTKQIAEILKEKGLIQSVLKFRMDSKKNQFDGTYKQGTYTVNTDMTPIQMMELFQQGGAMDERLKLVVPEGFTTAEIATRLEEKGIMTADDFINEANTGDFDFDFVKDLPERENRLEGYLFPDTYFLSESMTAHELIQKMLNRFSEIYEEKSGNMKSESTYSMDEIVTIASIIEAEIQVPEERKRAAGVIYNRLNLDMPLQMDATVLYAMGITKEDVLEKDLEVDSPYNTYQNKGLPIGPICSPGAASLAAALSPEENNYLYYVLEEKGKGNHIYTEDYESFLQAKERYKTSK